MNLSKIMKERGITQRELAESLGVSRQAVAYWQKGGNLSNERIKDIADRLHISADDLFGIETPKTVDASLPVPDGYIRVPVFDVFGSCGNGRENHSEVITGAVDLAEWFVRSLSGVTSINSLQIISSTGDSMTPTIEPRALLLVDRNQATFATGDGIYCLRIEDELYIKRVQRNIDGTLTLLSDNVLYKPMTVERSRLDQSAILGRVVFIFNGKNP